MPSGHGAWLTQPLTHLTFPGVYVCAGTCALPIKRDNPDGTTSLFARLDLTDTSNPTAPATCDAAMKAVEAMGGSLPDLNSAADVAALAPFVTAAAGKPVWVAPVDPTSAQAVALGYTSGPAPGQMAALVLVSPGTVRLVNVPCGTEGVALMQSDVVGDASAPTAITCGGEEGLAATGQECSYAVLNVSRPVSSSAAEALATALGKRLVSFASEAQYTAILESLAGTRAAALLARGSLAGLWVDMEGSAYRPAGYSLPGPGQAAMLVGSSLTPTNVPVSSTMGAVLVQKCSEVDDAIGKCVCGACNLMCHHRSAPCMLPVAFPLPAPASQGHSARLACCTAFPSHPAACLQAPARCPSSATTVMAPPACLLAWTSPTPPTRLALPPATRWTRLWRPWAAR